MGVDVDGTEQLAEAIDNFRDRFIEGVKNGLMAGAEKVITTAKEGYVPVQYGYLRASGFVEPAVEVGDAITVELGFGKDGPSRDYAFFVHERPAQHNVGQDKFLEIPAFEAQDMILQEIVDAVEESTGLK